VTARSTAAQVTASRGWPASMAARCWRPPRRSEPLEYLRRMRDPRMARQIRAYGTVMFAWKIPGEGRAYC